EEEARRGVAELVAHRGWNVQPQAAAGDGLVLDLLPFLAQARLVGPQLVENALAVDIPDRDQQAGHASLGSAEAQLLERPLPTNGSVAASDRDLGRDPGIGEELGVVREELRAVVPAAALLAATGVRC